MAVGMDNIKEAEDGRVVHLFEEGDFADCSRGDAFIFGFEANLLQGDDALVRCAEVACFVDDSVGA